MRSLITLCLVSIPALIMLALTMLSLTSCDQGEKRVLLKHKYKPGLELSYLQEIKGLAVERTSDSTCHDLSTEAEVNIGMYVRELVDDSLGKIIISYKQHTRSEDRISGKIKDTTATSPDLIATMAPSGEIIKMEMEDSVGNEAHLKYYRDLYQQGTPTYPASEVTQGFRWVQSFKVSIEGEEVDAATTYEVKAFVREAGYDCVLIEYSGNLVIPVLPEKGKDSTYLGGVDRVTSKGVIYFAYREGMTVIQKERWIRHGERKIRENEVVTNHYFESEYDVVLTLAAAPKIRTIPDGD